MRKATMANNYWMVVQTPDNFEVSKGRGFTIHGLTSRQRRRARRMEPNDRILFYIGGSVRKWSATATVTSKFFEDREPIWNVNETSRELFPYRVNISPALVLDEGDYIEGLEVAPRLEYLKRWPPDLWPLAFIDTLHLLPQKDFRLIESEMKRVLRKGHRYTGPRSQSQWRRDDTSQEEPSIEVDSEITAGENSVTT